MTIEKTLKEQIAELRAQKGLPPLEEEQDAASTSEVKTEEVVTITEGADPTPIEPDGEITEVAEEVVSVTPDFPKTKKKGGK